MKSLFAMYLQEMRVRKMIINVVMMKNIAILYTADSNHN